MGALLSETPYTEEVPHINAETFVQQFFVSFPAIVFISYCLINNLMDAIGVIISCVFVVIAHFPFTLKNWALIRLFLLSFIVYAFLFNWFPGFQNVPIWNNREISLGINSNLWVPIDLGLVVVTFVLTFFIKDQRYKVVDVQGSQLQFIQFLTPKYRSKIIVNSWFMAITSFLGLYFYFELGTIDLKFPYRWEYWLAVTLFITTLSQEFFFRGELQYYFTSKFGALGVVLASIVFGSFYLAISLEVALIMFAIGLCSGYSYYKTQLIVSSILIHISVLILHFFFLTYPFILKG